MSECAQEKAWMDGWSNDDRVCSRKSMDGWMDGAMMSECAQEIAWVDGWSNDVRVCSRKSMDGWMEQ